MMTCIIIDDEQHCVDTLTAMLAARLSSVIQITGSTTDSRKAVELITELQPDIVFVDVEMPHITGIQLMKSFPSRNFAVIYTTAYEKYALQAIKTAAVDYLLKPINLSELKEAVEKAAMRLLAIQSPPAKRMVIPQKLLLPVSNGLMAARVSEIIRIESNSNYCTVYLLDKPKVVIARTLKEYEEILAPCHFFRVHQSHLINLHFVEYIKQGVEEYVILNNGEQIEIARRRKAELLQKLSALPG